MDLGIKAGVQTNGPPRITAAVFADNWISESRIGTGISRRAEDTILQKTTLYDVAVPLVDRGENTHNREQTIRTDEDYTPERGPIR